MPSIGTYASVFILLVIGALAAGAAFNGSTHVFVESDNVTVNYSTPQAVDTDQPAETFHDNETVSNQSGSTLTEGTDYDWNTSTGEVTFYNTSATSEGNTATVDFAYDGHSDRATSNRDVLSLLYRIGALGLLVGAAVVLSKWTGWISGGVR
jgi:hypothetical protein